MLFTGQEYCKILNKNALPCIHGVLLACCLYAYFADLSRFQRVIAPLVFHSKEEKKASHSSSERQMREAKNTRLNWSSGRKSKVDLNHRCPCFILVH